MPGMPPAGICLEIYIFFEKKHPKLNPPSISFRLKPWLSFDIIHFYMPGMPPVGGISLETYIFFEKKHPE